MPLTRRILLSFACCVLLQLAPSTAGAVILRVRPQCPAAPGEYCTLSEAYAALLAAAGSDYTVDDNYTILIYGDASTPYYPGEDPPPYDPEEGRLYWRVYAPAHSIVIKAAPGNYPVFDGDSDGPGITNAEPKSALIEFRHPQNSNVNITVEGLTIQNFQNGALVLNSNPYGEECEAPPEWSSGYTIRKNIFLNIGNASFGMGHETCDGSDPENDSKGYSVVQPMSSRNNIIEDNVARHIYNCAGEANGIHFIYAHYETSSNTIRHNFIDDHSGDPFKFRGGSHDNLVTENFVHRGFNTAPGQEYRVPDEAPVRAISFIRNLFVYPYDPEFLLSWSVPACAPGSGYCFNGGVYACYLANACSNCNECSGSSVVNCTQGLDGDPTTCDGDQKFCRDGYTQSRLVDLDPMWLVVRAATSLGDDDGDGTADLVVAFEDQGVSWIVRSKLRPYYLGDVIWSSAVNDRVVAMTSGDFDGDGVKELVTAVEDATGNTRVYRGTGTPWANGMKDLSDPLYGPTTAWEVTALTAGNHDNVGDDELIMALEGTSAPIETRVYRGNGETSATDLGILYQLSGSWRVRSMASADFGNLSTGSNTGDGNTDVATAFYITGEDRVYVGDGETVATGLTGRQIFKSTTKRINALGAGEVNGNSDIDLITSYTEGTTRKVWRGNGWNSYSSNPNGVLTHSELYSSTFFWPGALVVDEFRSGDAQEVATVFQRSDEIQIWAGDGWTGLVSYWKFYDLAWEEPMSFAPRAHAASASQPDRADEDGVAGCAIGGGAPDGLAVVLVMLWRRGRGRGWRRRAR